MEKILGASNIVFVESMARERATSEWDIAILTRLMKQCDEQAYREFFARYYRRLWSYLIVVSKGNERHVEDALQVAFSRIVKRVRIFETEKDFWNWIRIVARNAYFDSCRKESALQRALRKIGLIGDEDDQSKDREARDLKLSFLNGAMSKLSDDERSLIHEKYIEGLAYTDIAYKLNVTEKAVESRLARIRRKLKTVIERSERYERNL